MKAVVRLDAKSNPLNDKTIVFAGAGAMAEAIIRGIIGKQAARPEQICAFGASNRAKTDALAARYGIRASCDAADKERFVGEADIVVLAMKPKDAAQALADMRSWLRREQLLVSVIAGLTIAAVERLVPSGMSVVRAMPNTSCSIGVGATGVSFSRGIREEEREAALALFQTTGMTAVVEEELLDAVTGVSGSGPAYIYYMMEAMIRAGIAAGLPEEQARRLTVQTVLGAATMVLETGEQPAELRRKVTSPNGTTEAALAVLDSFRFGEAVESAVLRAKERAGELGEALSRALHDR